MNKIRSFLTRQGFFMMLALCVTLIVGTGYWALRMNNEDKSLLADSAPEFVQTLDEAKAFHLISPTPGEPVKVFSPISYQQTLDQWEAHEAVDFSAKKGDTVYSAHEGVVLETFRDPQWGGVIVIQHDGDTKAKYCGLAWPMERSAGEQVEAGAPIGVIGVIPIESAQPSHLHFEMEINGRTIDPTLYM